MSKKISKLQAQQLILEKIQQIQLESEIREHRAELLETGDDFYGTVLKSLAEDQFADKGYDLTMLDEGFFGKMWDKAKNMVSFGKAADSSKLRAALEKGANASLTQFVDELEETAPNFPNTKNEDAFVAALAKIKALYDSIKQATTLSPQDEGFMNPDAANAVISALSDYLGSASGGLSRVYKYMKEENEDEDLLEENETIDEILGLGPKEKAARIIKKIAKAKAKGDGPKADKMANRLINYGEKLSNKSDKGGFTNNKEDALRSIQKYVGDNQGSGPGQLNPQDAIDVGIKKVPQNLSVTKNWGGGGGGGPEPEYDPSGDIEQGYQNQGDGPPEAYPESDPDTGLSDYDGDAYPESDVDMGDAGGDFGTSDVDPGEVGADGGGMLGKAADMVGISPRTLGYLGIAGVSVAAAYATYKFLKAKRAKGDSREGLMGAIEQSIKPVSATATDDTGAQGQDDEGSATEYGDDPRDAQMQAMAQGLEDNPGSSNLPAVAGGGTKLAPAGNQAQKDRAAASNQAAQNRGASPEKAAEPEAEPCPAGKTRDSSGNCVSFGSPSLKENKQLYRWQKIAGIIKG